MSSSPSAILLSDEPLTALVGAERLRAAGYGPRVVDCPQALLSGLASGGVALGVIDLDHTAELSPELRTAILDAAAAAGAGVVAVSASQPGAGPWPHVAGKPFTAQEARTWRALLVPRMGMAEATPLSVDRLAQSLGGEPADALAMLGDYADMALEQHDRLRVALSEADWPRVSELAHRLCGALGAIEARTAATTCRQLMQAAARGDLARARALGETVDPQLVAIEQKLRELLPGDRPRASGA
jgi:HPt (histidine-containing phosphotransfer) domain-containing protein